MPAFSDIGELGTVTSESSLGKAYLLLQIFTAF